MGRGKVELKRIENPTSRQVTFSKRRNGLLKKSLELSILCDAEVAILIFSPSGKAYQFASHDMNRTIARYRREVGFPLSSDQRSVSMEFWKTEIEELKRSANLLETRLKHLAGEDLSMLGMKELKQIERQIKTGVERIRSRKRRIMSENIKLLKIKDHKRKADVGSTGMRPNITCEQKALQEENSRLQKRVKLHELHDDNASSRASGKNVYNAYHARVLQN